MVALSKLLGGASVGNGGDSVAQIVELNAPPGKIYVAPDGREYLPTGYLTHPRNYPDFPAHALYPPIVSVAADQVGADPWEGLRNVKKIAPNRFVLASADPQASKLIYADVAGDGTISLQQHSWRVAANEFQSKELASPGLSVCDINPETGKVLYATTTGVGTISDLATDSYVEKAAIIKPVGVCYLGNNSGQYTWIAINNDGNTGSYIWRSVDDGETWASFQVPGWSWTGYVVKCFLHDGAGTACYHGYSNNFMYTTDFGATWEEFDPGGYTFNDQFVSGFVNPLTQEFVFTGSGSSSASSTIETVVFDIGDMAAGGTPYVLDSATKPGSMNWFPRYEVPIMIDTDGKVYVVLDYKDTSDAGAYRVEIGQIFSVDGASPFSPYFHFDTVDGDEVMLIGPPYGTGAKALLCEPRIGISTEAANKFVRVK